MISTRAFDENVKRMKKALRENDYDKANWFANNVKNDINGILVQIGKDV